MYQTWAILVQYGPSLYSFNLACLLQASVTFFHDISDIADVPPLHWVLSNEFAL